MKRDHQMTNQIIIVLLMDWCSFNIKPKGIPPMIKSEICFVLDYLSIRDIPPKHTNLNVFTPGAKHEGSILRMPTFKFEDLKLPQFLYPLGCAL